MEGVEAYGFSAAMSGAFLLSSLLFAAVNRRLREPYMDEVFHVPQAQAYCQGRFLQVGPALGAAFLGAPAGGSCRCRLAALGMGLCCRRERGAKVARKGGPRRAVPGCWCLKFVRHPH